MTIIAGTTQAGTAITVGSISTTGGSGGLGAVTLVNAAPTFTSGSQLSFGTNGAIVSGNDWKTIGLAFNTGDIVINNNINAGSSSVTIATGGTGSITTPVNRMSNISIGSAAGFAALTPDNAYLYVPDSGDNQVAVVRTSDMSVAARINLASSANPVQVVVNPAGTYAYVLDNHSGAVIVIDINPLSPTYNQVVDSLTIPGAVGNFDQAAFNPAGTRFYVPNYDAPDTNNHGIFVLNTSDPANPTQLANIPLAFRGASGIAINPAGTLAYVTNYNGAGNPYVQAVNLLTGAAVGSPIPGQGNQILASIDPTGQFVYAGNWYGGSTVAVIRTSDNSLVTNIPVGQWPSYVASNPQGTLAYVANSHDNTVSIINTATNQVVGNPISVGQFPFSIASGVVGENVMAYVSNAGDGTVSVLKTATVIGGNVNLQSGSGGITVATSAANLQANSSGDVNITQLGTVTVNSSSAGSSFALGATGSITTNWASPFQIPSGIFYAAALAPGATLTINQPVDVSGLAGWTGNNASIDGGSAGGISLSAYSDVTVQDLFAGGGGGVGVFNGTSGNGGNGGAIFVSSTQGNITTGGINTSGGGGGGASADGGTWLAGNGGNAGGIYVSALNGSYTANGPLLAAGGGGGGGSLGSYSYGGSGGASFYGAGGGSSGLAGGGGFYGGAGRYSLAGGRRGGGIAAPGTGRK